jgi:molybdopterin-containing oxidoreductase family membrane subunit
LILCNGLTPQLLWFKKIRTNIPMLFLISIVVSIGMWLERFVIIVTSLSFDFVPSSWAMYYPTATDILTFAGTLGFFTLLFLLFVRALPCISIAEMRELILHHGQHSGLADHDAAKHRAPGTGA